MKKSVLLFVLSLSVINIYADMGSFSKEEQIVINKFLHSFVYVEGGTFVMGATAEQGDNVLSDEYPSHIVTLPSYYISHNEITQEVWVAVMKNNPSKVQDNKYPVTNVSWKDIQLFIDRLNEFSDRGFRMPTEAEWEFAARGGVHSKNYKYAGADNVDSVAIYQANTESHIDSVSSLAANELGLFDCSGNVSEWVSDYYGLYSEVTDTAPRGPQYGSDRVYRGGSYLDEPDNCRVSRRFHANEEQTFDNVGFRLVHRESYACPHKLIVTTTDDVVSEYPLENHPQMSSVGQYFTINYEGESISIPLIQLKSMRYESLPLPTEIQEIKQFDDVKTFEIKDNVIRIHHLGNGGTIRLYSIDGKLVSSKRLISSDYSFSLNTIPTGIYLLQVNDVTYKISKQ